MAKLIIISKHVTLCACLSIMLSGCLRSFVANQLDSGMEKEEYVPSSIDLRPPSGPAKYQRGWMDGCESGLSSTNELVEPAFRNHVYTLDQTLVQDPMYYRVWQDAYNYCAFSMLTLMKYNSELD